MIGEAKSRYAVPIRALAAEMGLGASTLGRWRRRLGRGEVAVGRRGPRKVKPLNPSDLRDRCLGGGTACRAYFGGTRICYSRRKRAAVYLWVRELAAEVSVRAGESVITPTSWRIAARQWLVTNKLIKSILKNSILGAGDHRRCSLIV